jgi:glycosyltransferase involved in cell wall biosynthesis
LYDGTPTVVVEALAHGLPVICLDQFGCRDVVHAECGIKIQVRRFDQIVHDFAESIETLWGSEPRRYEMAIAAQKATVNLTWKYKASVLAELYRRMLAGNSGS